MCANVLLFNYMGLEAKQSYCDIALYEYMVDRSVNKTNMDTESESNLNLTLGRV